MARQDLQKKKFHDRLRGIVSRSGKDVRSISAECGISTSTLWGYTSGTRSPSAKMLKQILYVCGGEWSEVEP